MSNELISLLVLVLIFVIGTTMPVNMGVLGIVAAFVVGTAMGVSEDDIFLGFPGDLFIILVGVTYLFGIASSNGTVNWLVHASVRAVGGRVAAIPWVFLDRKSTRLNSSHSQISYAVFCLKKKIVTC